MNVSDGPFHVFYFLIALGYWAILIAAVTWGFYIAYLLTRALRKYLRT